MENEQPQKNIKEEANVTNNQQPQVAPAQSAQAQGAPAVAPSAPSTFKRRQRGQSFYKKEAVASEFVEKVISINRVTKVTKGGKKMGFSALVVVGDGKGRVGYNLGKSSEVANAIKKALIAAKKDMVRIPLRGSTITHTIIGVCGAASVMLKPAVDGTGVIAAGPVRAVCDAVGIRNILTKCHKSNNPINVVKATMDGLLRLKPLANVALVIDNKDVPLVVDNKEGSNAA